MPPLADFFQVVIRTILPIFLVIGAAMLVARYKTLDVRTLSRVTIYLFSPALILSRITESGLGAAELGSVALAATLLCLIMAGLGSLIARGLRYPRNIASSFVLAAFIMNSVNFGFPFIEFAFGPAGLDVAVPFFVGQVLIAYLLGTYVASRGRSSWKVAVRNVVTLPTPYAFLLAMALNVSDTSLPTPVLRATEVLGQGIVPASLVILGLQLRSARLRGLWGPILTATFTRFGVGVVVALGVAAVFNFQGLTRQVFVLEASMPAGMLTGVLATEFGGNAEYSAGIILVTTLLSTVFLSGLLIFLG